MSGEASDDYIPLNADCGAYEELSSKKCSKATIGKNSGGDTKLRHQL